MAKPLQLVNGTEVHPGLLTPRNCPAIDYRNIPSQFWGKVSAICRTHAECLDLHKWFGDENFAPIYPVLIVFPNPDPLHHQKVFYHQIDGMGIAPAWELRDTAVQVWEINDERFRRSGHFFNFDEAREKAGLLPRNKVDETIREGLWELAKEHKATPRTNPGRQPKYANPKGKVVFPEQPAQAWKGEKA